MERKESNFHLSTVLKYLIVYIGVIIIIIPIINILMSGFKTTGEINRVLSFPSSLYLGNFKNVLSSSYVRGSFINSAVITTVTILLNVILCSLAAYSLGRRKEKLFSLLYYFFLSAMMIPAVVNLSTLYSIVINLGLKDTRTALVLIYSAAQIPMGILLYTGFIKTLPRQLDEAAKIDGCNYLQTFFKVITPLLKPVTASYAVITVIYVWNDFLMPLMIISSQKKKTLTLAVYSFVSEHAADYGAIYAMLIVAMIPPILLFLASQKYFYRGITMGAVKG
jgi:raffinose/stachyose/melibiose transport system permease protein